MAGLFLKQIGDLWRHFSFWFEGLGKQPMSNLKLVGL